MHSGHYLLRRQLNIGVVQYGEATLQRIGFGDSDSNRFEARVRRFFRPEFSTVSTR